MPQNTTIGVLLLAAALLPAACTERAPEPSEETAAEEAGLQCDTTAVRQLAGDFGRRLKQVSLLAPDSILISTIRQTYAPVVTDALLQAWIADPSRAQGRDVSSPWPERIEIRSIEPEGTSCRIEGDVVYVTSTEMARGGEAFRRPVIVQVREEEGWRVSAYEAAELESSDSAGTPEEAVGVLRRYYSAINAKDFRTAYAFGASRDKDRSAGPD